LAGLTRYQLEVFTSDMRGAGTDADVFATIYGDQGNTGEHKLDTRGTNDFERGQVRKW